MLELEFSYEYHKKIIQLLLSSTRIVITVGKYSEIISKNLQKISRLFILKSYLCYNKLIKEIKHNDLIMIKGSNSIKLSLISKALCEEN